MSDASNQAATQHLLPGLDPTIIAGYEAQKTILVDLLSRIDVAAYEILNDNIGLLAVATMHTFSRGSVHINSTNPLLQPAIDPRYCSNPLDCQILVEALLFNNQLVNTSSMKLLEPGPYYPFFPDATAETLMPAIQTGIRTEFHGTGSTSMLPINLGGVVDTHLRVYGTKNLRIVDAGIMPLIPAAHLQAPVYAIAEKVGVSLPHPTLTYTVLGCRHHQERQFRLDPRELWVEFSLCAARSSRFKFLCYYIKTHIISNSIDLPSIVELKCSGRF